MLWSLPVQNNTYRGHVNEWRSASQGAELLPISKTTNSQIIVLLNEAQ